MSILSISHEFHTPTQDYLQDPQAEYSVITNLITARIRNMVYNMDKYVEHLLYVNSG